LYDGVRCVTRRLAIGTSVLHLGKVGFSIASPLAYAMGARDAVELVWLFRPASVVPVHYEGWSHFREGRDGLTIALRDAADVAETFWWATLGEPLNVVA
jgi:L-ascorbate metabolism protein UlaG (beta-lactamase superfamily)